jgi:hypothetical protein
MPDRGGQPLVFAACFCRSSRSNSTPSRPSERTNGTRYASSCIPDSEPTGQLSRYWLFMHTSGRFDSHRANATPATKGRQRGTRRWRMASLSRGLSHFDAAVEHSSVEHSLGVSWKNQSVVGSRNRLHTCGFYVTFGYLPLPERHYGVAVRRGGAVGGAVRLLSAVGGAGEACAGCTPPTFHQQKRGERRYQIAPSCSHPQRGQRTP